MGFKVSDSEYEKTTREMYTAAMLLKDLMTQYVDVLTSVKSRAIQDVLINNGIQNIVDAVSANIGAVDELYTDLCANNYNFLSDVDLVDALDSDSIIGALLAGVISGGGDLETSLKIGKGKIGKTTQIAGHEIEKTKYSGDENWKDNDVSDLKGSVKIAEIGGTIGGSLLSASGSFENGIFSADGSVSIGTAEAEAKASANLYKTDKDGNLVFAPGVSAEIGASVCAISGAAAVGIGNSMLGVNASGNAEAISAGASASGKVEIIDKNGKFNPTAKVGLEAEANLFKAEGKVSGSVLGVDAAVTGGVTIGVGAHADIGFQDGIFKFDVGASLGVGVSIGFEVNVGELVGGVLGVATSVFEWLL